MNISFKYKDENFGGFDDNDLVLLYQPDKYFDPTDVYLYNCKTAILYGPKSLIDGMVNEGLGQYPCSGYPAKIACQDSALKVVSLELV